MKERKKGCQEMGKRKNGQISIKQPNGGFKPK